MFASVGFVTLPLLEHYLNWVHEDHPPPSRDHGKENLPPTEEPCKLPRPSSVHSTHSLPTQQPITIQNGPVSWTRLNLAAYINRPGPVSARMRRAGVADFSLVNQKLRERE